MTDVTNILGSLVRGLLANRTGEGAWGNGWIFMLLILFLPIFMMFMPMFMMMGNNGFWGNNVASAALAGGIAANSDVATKTDIYASQNYNRIQDGIQGLGLQQNNAFQQTMQQIAGVNAGIIAQFGGVAQQLGDIKYENLKAECDTQRSIDNTNYNMQRGFCENSGQMNIIAMNQQAQFNAGIQKVLDKLCEQNEERLKDELQLERTLNAAKQVELNNRIQGINLNNTIIREGNAIVDAIRPYPVPSWPVSSPYVSLNYGYGYGFGYNGGAFNGVNGGYYPNYGI